jgi:hypothetical protein
MTKVEVSNVSCYLQVLFKILNSLVVVIIYNNSLECEKDM